MRFLNRLWPGRSERKSAVPAPVNVGGAGSMVPFGDLAEFMFGVNPASNIPPYLCWRLYKSVSTLAKVVDLIADQTARLAPIVMVDGEPAPDHPLNALLANPGYGRSRRQLIKDLAIQQLVSGTAYLHAIGLVDRPPRALDVLKSHFVNPVQGPDMWPMTLIYSEGTRHTNFQREGGIDLRFTDGRLNEAMVIIDTSGDFRGIGLSRLQAVRADVELRLDGVRHNSGLMRNGATPSWLISFKEELTPEQAADIGRSLHEQISGPGNAGKFAIFGGGSAEMKALSMSARDMDWANLARLTDDAIVARYNVPVTLFNVQAQTNNNYETAWSMLYDNAVVPTFDVLFDGIARLASQRWGEAITIVHDPLSNAILARQASARARELYAANLVTRNEARLMIGYEATVGGDTFFQSMGLVPSGFDYFTDHGTPPPGVADALGLDKDGDGAAAGESGGVPDIAEPGPDGTSSEAAKMAASTARIPGKTRKGSSGRRSLLN